MAKINEFIGRIDFKHGAPSGAYLSIENFDRSIHSSSLHYQRLTWFNACGWLCLPCRISPSVQQHALLPLLVEANAKNVFLILLVQPDTGRMAEQLKQLAVPMHLHHTTALETRSRVLQVCAEERVGYTRDGLEALMSHSNFSISRCLKLLQRVFVRTQFISSANVSKVLAPASSSVDASPALQLARFPLSIVRMNEPLRRCAKCTLIPPCAHISLEMMHDKAQRVRSTYQQQRGKERVDPNAGAALCPSFTRRGICSNMQRLGRCRYAHPLELHVIDSQAALVKRCAVHTLPLPCLHCSNVARLAKELRNEQQAMVQLEQSLRAARSLVSELELKRYLFVRDHAKVLKWGSAKKEYDTKVEQIDAKVKAAQAEVGRENEDATRKALRIAQLAQDLERGKSKGTGKAQAGPGIIGLELNQPIAS